MRATCSSVLQFWKKNPLYWFFGGWQNSPNNFLYWLSLHRYVTVINFAPALRIIIIIIIKSVLNNYNIPGICCQWLLTTSCKSDQIFSLRSILKHLKEALKMADLRRLAPTCADQETTKVVACFRYTAELLSTQITEKLFLVSI